MMRAYMRQGIRLNGRTWKFGKYKSEGQPGEEGNDHIDCPNCSRFIYGENDHS